MATGFGGVKAVVDNWEGIQSFAIYPALFFGVVGGIGVYIWLNSFKYRKYFKKAKEETTITKDENNSGEFVNCPKCGLLNNVSKRITCYDCGTVLPKEET